MRPTSRSTPNTFRQQIDMIASVTFAIPFDDRTTFSIYRRALRAPGHARQLRFRKQQCDVRYRLALLGQR